MDLNEAIQSLSEAKNINSLYYTSKITDVIDNLSDTILNANKQVVKQHPNLKPKLKKLQGLIEDAWDISSEIHSDIYYNEQGNK